MDSMDELRKLLAERVNSVEYTREDIRRYGEVWDSEELRRDFEVLGFAAPYVVVRRRSDGVVGTLMFRHSPRLYFAWVPDNDQV